MHANRLISTDMAVAQNAQDDDANEQRRSCHVGHPGSDWQPAFAERQREEPLGPAFDVYCHHLGRAVYGWEKLLFKRRNIAPRSFT